MPCREGFEAFSVEISFSEEANRCISRRRYVPAVGTANVKYPAMRHFAPGNRLRPDYRGTGFSTAPHAMKLIRSQFPDMWRASDLADARNGTLAKSQGR